MNTTPLRSAGISAAREYQSLPAWQKAIELAQSALKLSANIDNAVLDTEFCAAATRIATNIAAGSAKPNEQGMLNAYFDAQAATAEFNTVAVLAEKLGYISAEELASLTETNDAVARLLVGMRHGLKVEAKDEKRRSNEKAKLDREYEERQSRPRRDLRWRNREGYRASHYWQDRHRWWHRLRNGIRWPGYRGAVDGRADDRLQYVD